MKFESHLYGIETGAEIDGLVAVGGLNRTFMELKRMC